MFGDSPFGPIGKTNLAWPSSASINEKPCDPENRCPDTRLGVFQTETIVN
jgi:hypothetical protein